MHGFDEWLHIIDCVLDEDLDLRLKRILQAIKLSDPMYKSREE